MKKLILILVFAAAAMLVNAQRFNVMPLQNTYLETRVTATDTVKNTGVKTYVLEAARNVPFTYDIQLKLDTVTTPGNNSGVSVQLVGKKFEGDAWSNIGSAVVWKSLAVHDVGADTTITWSATSVVRWRYLGVKLTGAGTHIMKVNHLLWKLWE